MKFLHSMGAIGMMGAIAALLVLIRLVPKPLSLPEHASAYRAMADIANYILYPSMVVTVIAGLLAIAINRGFHNAGWAWVKMASGILVFEGSLVSIIGPIGAEARRSSEALLGQIDPATLVSIESSLGASLWVMLGVSTANVVFGIWRPRLTRIPD
jgi:hypothetical protein